MTTSQITRVDQRSLARRQLPTRTKLRRKNKQTPGICGISACALTHSKFDHSRHQRIMRLLIIRILNSKYLNDEGERGSKHTHTHTHTYRRDAICLFQTASARRRRAGEREREQFTQSFIKQSEEGKKWIYTSTKISAEKKPKWERARRRDITLFGAYSIETTRTALDRRTSLVTVSGTRVSIRCDHFFSPLSTFSCHLAQRRRQSVRRCLLATVQY